MSAKKFTIIFISLFVIIFILIPSIVIYVLNNGNPITKYKLDRHVPSYLQEQGYSNDELLEATYIETKHLINDDYYHEHYRVIFRDEPDITYYYGFSKEDKLVHQFCMRELEEDGVVDDVEGETKHTEENCEKHYY